MIAAAAGLVTALAFSVTGWESLDGRVFQIGAAFAIAAALGDSARSRQAFLVQAEDRAARAERSREAEARRRVSEERLRIARDLHDTVAHQISLINLQAGAASGYLTTQPDRAESALSTIREAARGALGDIGELLRHLRDDADTDAVPAQHGLDALEALVRRLEDSGLEIETDIGGDLAAITGLTGTVAYRVIQEGLVNAHKHGSGNRASLHVSAGRRQVHIEIENPADDTADSASRTTPHSGTGLGLIGLRERVSVAQGTVTTSRSDGAHRLVVELPLQPTDGGAR
ncbi:sensor histidine kinase [Brachybacterium sp. GCM10030267]|uniref:sensor histidine kinase n=1 Tax=Brachybacterium sp. GCM10030267 TaxID=3273381 RepID=UPI003613C363